MEFRSILNIVVRASNKIGNSGTYLGLPHIGKFLISVRVSAPERDSVNIYAQAGLHEGERSCVKTLQC